MSQDAEDKKEFLFSTLEKLHQELADVLPKGFATFQRLEDDSMVVYIGGRVILLHGDGRIDEAVLCDPLPWTITETHYKPSKVKGKGKANEPSC